MNEEPHAKSHEEILQLLQELETVEEQLKHPQTLQPTSETVEIPLPEEQTEAPEWQSVEDKPKKQKKRLFKHKTTTREDFEEHVENFLASPEKKHRFKLRKHTPEPDILDMTTIRSTFTLHRNDEGNLIGFPEKKPLPEPKPKKQRRLFKRKQGSDQEPKPHEEGKKGIASRIKRIIPLRRKGKEQAASDGSKLSKITGKLKGVIPRRKNK